MNVTLKHLNVLNRQRKAEEQIRKQMAELQDDLRNLPRQPPRELVLEPLAKDITEHMEWEGFSVDGPYGIGGNYSVTFKPVVDDENSWKYLTLIFGWDKNQLAWLGYRDYTTNTGEFKKNTIGALNGMNHPIVRVPDNADLDYWVNLIEEKNQKE
jgi:hypothetical protein